MQWVCKYATGRKECSFRPVMYAGMLRENLFVEPYDDGSGTKIEGQVLQFNHHAVKKCLSPCFAARGIPPIATDLSPHYSRRLLLQPPPCRCDKPGRKLDAARRAGSPLGRSTYCFKYASLPRRLGSGACLVHSYKGASPLVESPRRGHTPFGTPRRGVASPRGSTRPSRGASRRFHHEPS